MSPPPTIWQTNNGVTSRPGIPSSRAGGVSPSVPEMKLMTGSSGATSTLPDGSEVHAFPHLTDPSQVVIHHKATDGTHTPLSPRTRNIVVQQNAFALRAVTARGHKASLESDNLKELGAALANSGRNQLG